MLLFESRVLSTCYPKQSHRTFDINPINTVLVVRVGLASRRHLQVVGVVLSYRVWEVITCSFFWIYVVGDNLGLLYC
jgi:hypothetical protein